MTTKNSAEEQATTDRVGSAQTLRAQRIQEDRVLWNAILREDPDALADAYRRYGRKTYQVAFGLLRSAELAEDVTQEVFVRLWRSPQRFDPERGTLAGFLRLDAHGRSIDLVRSEHARADREARDHKLSTSDSTPGAEEQVMKRIASAKVRHGLAQLRDEERLPITLAFFDGLSYRMVATKLGLPEGTVKSRIRKGLVRLQALLGEEAPLVG